MQQEVTALLKGILLQVKLQITRLINLIQEIHQVLMKLLDMMVWELRIKILLQMKV